MPLRDLRLTPEKYRRVTFVAVVLLGIIIVTGAAVRLSGSGLGCPDWPSCHTLERHGSLDGNAAIEFGNRLFTGLVGLAVMFCVLGSLRREPRRRDLVRLSWGLVVGLFAQGLLGGLLVLTELPPQLVMGHFLLSMVLLTNAVVLHRRAGQGDGPAQPVVHPMVRLAGHAVLLTAAVVVLAGTVVTATGPHGGDRRAERFDLDVRDVTKIHGGAVIAFVVTIFLAFVLLRRTKAPSDPQARLGFLAGLVLVQAAIGYIQYFNDIPALLVGFHVAGATVVWIASLSFWLCLTDRPAASHEAMKEPTAALADA
ncbi:MAG: heme A synthase [Actinobacteria bacterium]|nr:heme A synthase [Actinomycetota bacterium]